MWDYATEWEKKCKVFAALIPLLSHYGEWSTRFFSLFLLYYYDLWNTRNGKKYDRHVRRDVYASFRFACGFLSSTAGVDKLKQKSAFVFRAAWDLSSVALAKEDKQKQKTNISYADKQKYKNNKQKYKTPQKTTGQACMGIHTIVMRSLRDGNEAERLGNPEE